MISDRLKHLLKHYNMTAYQFEKEIGAGKNAIAIPIRNATTIGSELIGKIFTRFPEISLEWLISGKGYFLKNPNKTFQRKAISVSTNDSTNESTNESKCEDLLV